jgi:prefoldin beta subunit
MEMSDETRKDVNEFQNAQQQLQMVLMQKQQIQLQLAEMSKVGDELGKAAGDAKFFKSVGNVLVPKSKDELQKDLASEKETLELRAGMLAKQEEKLSSRLLELQDKLRKAEKGFSLGGDGASPKPPSRR